jgi:hypothetical protein
MLLKALSVSCAQAQLHSFEPVALTVADSKAVLCDNAIITSVWQGQMQLADTVVMGNGTSLTVIRALAKTAIIDGGNAVQLFVV